MPHVLYIESANLTMSWRAVRDLPVRCVDSSCPVERRRSAGPGGHSLSHYSNSPAPHNSLPCQQQAVACLCPEPDESSLVSAIPRIRLFTSTASRRVSVAQSLCWLNKGCNSSFGLPHNFVFPSMDGCQWQLGFFHRGINGRGIKLTAHRLVSKLRMGGAMLSRACALVACVETAWPLLL